MLLIVTIKLLLISTSTSYVLECKSLPSETLDGFYEFVSKSSGFADVCPFEISGDACETSQDYPDGYTIPNGENLYISCDPYRRESKCIIDCPVKSYFIVSTGASLSLESMSLSRATESAIYVEAEGQLTVFDSIFEKNVAKVGHNGGAIYASADSIVQIRFSDFEGNQAMIGGAVFNMGKTSIAQSNFRKNIAAAAVSAFAMSILGPTGIENCF
jgi:predicted outer membrane repeat protein